MNFAFSEEQEEFRELVKRFVADRWPVAETRRLLDTPTGYEPAVWKQMAEELGLLGLAIPEAYGGQGFSSIELGIALEELGRELAGGPLFATACLGANALLNGGSEEDRKRWLPGIAAGETRATLVEGDIQAEGESLRGSAQWVMDAQNADLLIVAAGASLYAIDADASGVTIRPTETLDLTRRYAEVEFEGASAHELRASGGALEKTRLQAAVLLSADQAGGAARCLEMAVDYAKERIQFGRPVGSFQAIKHRVADAFMFVEMARSAAFWAWWVAAKDAEDLTELREATQVVKSLCSQAYDRATRDNIQIHGGMGVTWEHDAHLYFRRAHADATLFGSPAQHRAALARQLSLRS